MLEKIQQFLGIKSPSIETAASPTAKRGSDGDAGTNKLSNALSQALIKLKEAKQKFFGEIPRASSQQMPRGSSFPEPIIKEAKSGMLTGVKKQMAKSNIAKNGNNLLNKIKEHTFGTRATFTTTVTVDNPPDFKPVTFAKLTDAKSDKDLLQAEGEKFVNAAKDETDIKNREEFVKNLNAWVEEKPIENRAGVAREILANWDIGVLSLKDKGLTTLPEAALSKMPLLSYLDVSGNPNLQSPITARPQEFINDHPTMVTLRAPDENGKPKIFGKEIKDNGHTQTDSSIFYYGDEFSPPPLSPPPQDF